MFIKNCFKHLSIVIRHKNAVLVHCARCGILWRGLMHDLSKFHPVEFFESAKYYQGNRSPIPVCRKEKGLSYAWLHHKAVNKHHIEYWIDPDAPEPPLLPYKYAVECVCDKLAASKTYNGNNYTPEKALDHWVRVGCKVNGNPRTMAFIERVFTDLVKYGEKHVLNRKYMKATYKEICTPYKKDPDWTSDMY